MRYTLASKFKVIDITDSAILKDIKARLRSGDRLVILEFTNKENKSKEGSGINGENNGDEENKSREGSRIDGENNSKNNGENKDG